MNTPSLLYYCPSSYGGIADYGLAQCTALRDYGISVTLLGPRSLLERTPAGIEVEPLADHGSINLTLPQWRRRIAHLQVVRHNIATLETAIRRTGCRHVLLAAYAEYGAPLWCGSLETLAASGVHFGAVLHDPIRHHVVGPPWWHWYSVRRAYSFIRDIFVHEQVDRAEANIPEGVRVTVIPHGPYAFPPAGSTRAEVRDHYQIPPNVYLLLSFGHIRDSKNLNLVIDALRDDNDTWLLTAGKEGGSGQKSIAYYQSLAETNGVADRCRWETGFIPPDEVGNLFIAADAVLMTYSGTFRSASGVLNAAVHYETPCLVSCGAGPLRTQTERYALGLWIQPDSRAAIVEGLRSLRTAPMTPRWNEYKQDNSWTANAHLVSAQLFSTR